MTWHDKWYRGHVVFWLLWPFALMFRLLSSLRRYAYKQGWFESARPQAVVVVVGNLSVGGNGKTPTVLALAKTLTLSGYKVGIVSRGYGGAISNFPHLVSVTDSASDVGDEPALMARRNVCPVVIDPLRARGANYLIKHAQCNVVLCDDGLQHYALQRDVELVVMDNRLLGSGHLLPMGPLREGPWRLHSVDGIIYNTSERLPSAEFGGTKAVQLTLNASVIINVKDPSIRITIDEFIGRRTELVAIAAIGNPQRFYDFLLQLGIPLADTKSFTDHHQFRQQDIPESSVLMTEKDAVKIAQFAHEECWYLPVEADFEQQFFTWFEQRIAAKYKELFNGI